jgi:pyruvate formate lyase activating enzyme
LWSAKELSAKEVIRQALNDRSYYEMSKGGITVSGGEPLLQIDFFCELAKLAKKHGLSIAMDTCGYALPQVFMKSLPLVDVYLFDLKFIDPKLHKKYTGRTNEFILDNFKRLHEAKKQVAVRVPLIPGITDVRENLAQIHEFIKSVDSTINITHIPFNALMLSKYSMLGKICPFLPGK